MASRRAPDSARSSSSNNNNKQRGNHVSGASEKQRSSPSPKSAAAPRGRAKGAGQQPASAWDGHAVSRLEAAQRGMDEEDVLLDSYLSSLRLTRKHTPKDGACLFRAVAEQVYHTQALHGVVREECVEYLQEHHKDFAAFICVNGRPYDDYVNKMRKPTTWGGEVELQALSNRYRANFQIYQLGEQVMTIDNGFGKTYQLCFSHGNHYDIVYPESTMDALSLCQSLVYELVDQALERCETKSDAPCPPVITGAGWKYKNVELECWIEESQRREMEDIQLARTLATNGNGAHYNGGEAEGEGDFQRVGRKKHNKIVSNTHSFPALKPKAVAPAAPRIEGKAPENRGPSSVEHIFRTVAQEESPWVLKRRQQEEERKRQRELEQQQQRDEEEERRRQPEQEQRSVDVPTASPAALKRKEKTHKPGAQHHPRSREAAGRGMRDNPPYTASSSPSIPPPSSVNAASVTAVTESSSLVAPSIAPPASKWGAKKDWKRHLESAPAPKPVKDGHSRSSPAPPPLSSSTNSTAAANQHRSSLSPREKDAAAALSLPQDAAAAAAAAPATGRDASPPLPLASPERDFVPTVPLSSAQPTSSQPTSTSTAPASTATTFTWAALVKTKQPSVGKATVSNPGRSSSSDSTADPGRASQSALSDRTPETQSLINPSELPASDIPPPSQEEVIERTDVRLPARSKRSSAEKDAGPSSLSRTQATEVTSALFDTQETALGIGPGATGHSSPRALTSTAISEKLVGNEPTALDNASSTGFAKYSPSIPPYLEDHAVPEDKVQVSFSFGAFQQATAKGANRTSASKIVEGVDMDDVADLGITFGDFRVASEDDLPSGTATSLAAAADFTPNGESQHFASGAAYHQQTTEEEEEEEAEKAERPRMSENGVSSSQPGIGQASSSVASSSRDTHAEPLNSSANQLPAKKGASGTRHGSAGNSKATAAGSKVSYGERPRGGRNRATNGNNHNHNHHQAPPQRGGSNAGATGSNYFSPGGTHYGVAYSAAHQAPYGVPAHPYPHGVASPPPPHNYPPFQPMPLHYPEYPVYYHHPPYEFGPAGYHAYPPYDHVTAPAYGMSPHYEGGYDAAYEGYAHEGYPEAPYAPYASFGPQVVEEESDVSEAQAHQ